MIPAPALTEAAFILAPDQVFDGQTLQGNLALQIAGGMVTALVPKGAGGHAVKGTLTPGYLDLQVNGGGGLQFNGSPEPATIHGMIAALRRFGTVGIMPTVITDAPSVLDAAVAAAMAVHGTPGLLGLHIEGPHISLPRRGTHAAEHVRPLDARTIAHVARLRAAGLQVMITLAPEAVQAGQVRELTGLGAIVSIGHSDATDRDVEALLAEGATCFTHLFNAMSPMLNRAPGVTGAAINSDAYCGFICDGHHVADAMLGLAHRARPVRGRMFLVSDCMATVGGSDRFHLYGQEIRLVDGRLVNAEGSLAGAHVTMAQSVARLITTVGLTPVDALHAAVTAPAMLIGRGDLASLLGRRLDDLLVLGPDWMPVPGALYPSGTALA